MSPDLYVIVYEVLDGEAEWFFKPETEMHQTYAEKLALDAYREHAGYEPDEKLSLSEVIGSVWYEKAYAPGYKITLEEVK